MEKYNLKELTTSEIRVIIASLYNLDIKGREARSFISLVNNIEKQLDKIEASSLKS